MILFKSSLISVLLTVLLVACSGSGVAPEPVGAQNTATPVSTTAVASEKETQTPQPTQEQKADAVAGGFPVTIENCGLTQTFTAPPKRAVSMNQSATEIMLALGLEKQMIGTAYLDDKILPEYQAAYQKIPVLAEEYPSQEELFAVEPDFVYSAYSSAFDKEAAGPREELLKLGIASYVSPPACADKTLRPKAVTIDTIYGEIRDIGHIFGVSDRAESLIAGMQAKLADIKAKIGDVGKPVQIFWYDSDDNGPFVGTCCGAPNEIIKLAGAENIFADVEGSWATVSWEEVIARSPETIVLIDAEWSPAQDKIKLLKTNPAYANLPAVKDQRFITIPFSAATPGIRLVSAVETLAKGLYPAKFE
ncbi:MAG: ABC transporter substrate-binding protein [Anaerolineae bacterium]|nr:ABC transporter substrate-binding protein [Anaerolineae bacterium]